ncbi:DUF4344 domain-containing metallopeptidase [Stutzerimonas kunmingensis]|uniref:DUF4344 domain-containing metallopeptidase n=1 Tax=Stutzerimonas kunmingensis TaxID=1211807 RepID=UPI00241BFCC5|nr:DUF4344 domain-containing metallopeptidase [Stutzerimonas kunmingensis]
MKCLALLPLLLLPLLAHAQQGDPAAELSVDEVRFTVANSEFTLMHEMGHLLISELQLPVLGREEDAADQLGFMGLFLLQQEQHRDDFYAKLMDVADYWRLEWQHAERDGSPVPVWDSHALDSQRFYNIACLAYGSDPDRLDWVLEVSGLPVERALYCPEEYEQAAHAVQWFREHFGRSDERPARHRIQVIYDTPPGHLPGGAELLEKIRASGELEAVAAKASDAFALPRDLTLRMSTCGAPDAWFNRISGELTLCYERIAYFRTLARELPKLRGGESPTPR